MKTHRGGWVFLWALGAAGVLGAACTSPFGIGAPIHGTGGTGGASASAGTGGTGAGGGSAGGAGGATPGASSSSSSAGSNGSTASSSSSSGTTTTGSSSSSSASGSTCGACDSPPTCYQAPGECSGGVCTYSDFAPDGTLCSGGKCNGHGVCVQSTSSSSSSSSSASSASGATLCGTQTCSKLQCCCAGPTMAPSCALLDICLSPNTCSAGAMGADAG